MTRDFYRRTEMIPYLARTLSSLAQLSEKQKRFVRAQEMQAEAETLIQNLTP